MINYDQMTLTTMIIYDQMIVKIRMMMPVRWKIAMVSVMMIKELKVGKKGV